MAATKSTSGKKKSGGSSSKSGGGAGGMLQSVVGGAGADTILDLVERLGLVDVVLGKVKSRIEETDIDEVLDDVADYLRRNPEVLVVSLGAVTVATGLLVWLNNRREWDGNERRGTGSSSSRGKTKGGAKNVVVLDEDDDDSDDDE
jgi:hypothetical protein